MNDDEIAKIIELYGYAAQRFTCPHSVGMALYIGMGLSLVAYPGTAGDAEQPKRDLFLAALGFQQTDEHGEPLHTHTAH
jgi:hypothetical protein